jgi:hypothetical protein
MDDDSPRRPKPKRFASDENAAVGPKPQRFSNPNYGRYKRSKKHEDRIGSALGGKRLPRSGGLLWSRLESAGGKTAGGDVKTPDYLIEHKRTVKDSISIKREWLDKVREGANSCLRDPALVVTFEVEGSTEPPEDWVMVPIAVFRRLTGKDGE